MAATVALALAWGLIVAAPFVVGAWHAEARARARALADRRRAARAPRRPVRRAGERVATLPLAAAAIALLRRFSGRRRTQGEAGALSVELPVVVDLLNVGVGAGLAPYEAIELAVRWAPPAAAAALGTVPVACRLGATLDEALRDAGRQAPAIRPLADTVRTAARLGAPLAPALTRLADEARADLRRAAEARARTVPVRLLFPLVFLVLPAFGLLTVVPALLAGFTHR